MPQTNTPAGEVIENARRDLGWKPHDLIAEVKRTLGEKRVFSPQTLDNIERSRTKTPDTYIAHAIVYVLNLKGRKVYGDDWEILRVSTLWPKGSR